MQAFNRGWLSDTRLARVTLAPPHRRKEIRARCCVIFVRRFLRCHLVASRRPEPEECRNSGGDSLQCLPLLTPTNFQLFTSFVVHADVMCQHIAEQLHQRRSHEAATALMQASAAAETSMQSLSAGMDAVVEDQKSVVRSQSVVVDSVRHAAAAIREHHERLKASVASLADTSDEAFKRMQSKLGRIDSTLDTILDLETSIIGFVDSAGATVWYASVVAAAWVVSSSPQTARSRPAMLLLTGIAVTMEWAAWWSASSRAAAAAPGAAWEPLEVLRDRAGDVVSCLRWTHALSLVSVVLWHWLTFTDPGTLALQKLVSLEALLGSSIAKVATGPTCNNAPAAPPTPVDAFDRDSDSDADPCDGSPLPPEAATKKRASSSKRRRGARVRKALSP